MQYSSLFQYLIDILLAQISLLTQQNPYSNFFIPAKRLILIYFMHPEVPYFLSQINLFLFTYIYFQDSIMKPDLIIWLSLPYIQDQAITYLEDLFILLICQLNHLLSLFFFLIFSFFLIFYTSSDNLLYIYTYPFLLEVTFSIFQKDFSLFNPSLCSDTFLSNSFHFPSYIQKPPCLQLNFDVFLHEHCPNGHLQTLFFKRCFCKAVLLNELPPAQHGNLNKFDGSSKSLKYCYQYLILINDIQSIKDIFNTIQEMERPGEQFRSRREQFTTEIRRQNRQQILAKRRNILIENQKQKKQQTISNVTPPTIQTETKSPNLPETNVQINTKSKYHVIDPRFQKEIQQFQKVNVYKQPFLNFVTAIHDPDILQQHYGIIGIKKILTISNKPPIQQVVDSGLIPRLIQYAKQTEYPQLQLEAVWCLTNVASGNNSQTGPIIEKGGIKIFVDLLLSVHAGIVEQAIWVLGNIARDSSNYREKIIKEGGLKNLIKLIELAISQLQSNQGMREIIESATWTLSGICQTPPIPAFTQIRQALAMFEYVIKNNLISDISIVGNVCYAISNYVNSTKETTKKIDKIQQCINSGVVPKIVEYLEHEYDNLVIACLKIVGNIAAGTIAQSKYLISLNVIPKLEQLLDKNKKIIRRESCWVLSNLTAGSMQQIEAVFSQQSLVSKLIQMMKEDQVTIRSEICYIFANSTEQGDAAKIAQFLAELQYMKLLVQNLYTQDKDLIYSVLECIEIMLHFGAKNNGRAKNNIYVTQLYKLKAVARLEDLQYHDEDKIYEIVAKIIPKFFDLEDPLKL